MSLPLVHVRATLYLLKRTENYSLSCIAISCDRPLDSDDVCKAIEVNGSWSLIRGYPGPRLQLARLLLCPEHREELDEATVQAWIELRPRDDLFKLFGLKTLPYQWSCIATQCDADFLSWDDRRDILAIIYKLAVGDVRGDWASGEQRKKLVEELARRLHCDKHRTGCRVKRICNDWDARLAAALESERSTTRSDTSSCFTASPSRNQASPRSGKSNDAVPRNTANPPKMSLFGSSDTNLSPPSISVTPSATEDQKRSRPQGVKRPLASTAGNQMEDPSESNEDASPISKKLSVTSRERCEDPFTEDSGHSPPAMHRLDVFRSRSSSILTSSGQLKHEASHSQSRRTQSSPALPETICHQETDAGIGRRRSLSRSPTPAQAPEHEVFNKAKDPREILPARDIDNELLEIIREPIDKPKNPKIKDSSQKAQGNDADKQEEESIGYIYVIKNPHWPNHVKIGRTGQSVKQRKEQIRKACKFQRLEQVVDGGQTKFPNYQLVERLCHKELQNFQKKFSCGCHKSHTGNQGEHHEWFELSENTAVETVQKWRTWLRTSPHDKDGNLKSWWRDRASRGLLPYGHEEESIEDHKIRHQRWSLWLRAPTVRDRVGFEIWKFLFEARTHRQPSRWEVAKAMPERLVCSLFAVYFLSGPKESILLCLILLFVI